MLQNKLMITIIDEQGSKQLNFSKNLKRNLVLLILAFLLIVTLGVVFLRFLIARIDVMTTERNAVLRDFRALYQKNHALKTEIKNKREEIFIVGQKIRGLESLIEVKKGANGGVHLYDKVDLENLSLAQKNLALMLIPNGKPLNTYSAINSTKERNHPIKKVKGIESGLDFIVESNTPVYATADGIVDFVKTNSNVGYGNLVRLEHAFGFSSIYAHLDHVIVRYKTFIQKGQLIGYSGKSGNSGGEKLHYEVRFLGKILNANHFLAWNLDNFQSALEENKFIEWKNLFWVLEDIVQLQEHVDKEAK
ncbi:M23 family metallopeptidase [Helicobacter cetorum]|uniref:ToxR-activated protein n=1 Tax=Helicobacter cetorum (strain ATCC BAA-540 / CCUG 52418 / MIT 99-5656) TaxID=1163745 RepID=I0ES66_HELCM|nr:M23 family metallopeptidase [Helicobacter cetorum]AFI05785.1 toxR-activated protein [Helicobacter cetorum MIT 99-5656]